MDIIGSVVFCSPARFISLPMQVLFGSVLNGLLA